MGISNTCARVLVIREDRKRTNENQAFKHHAVPQGDTVLDRHSVADDCVGFHKHVIAEVAVLADPRSFHDVGERPDASARAHVRRLNHCQRMFEIVNFFRHSQFP